APAGYSIFSTPSIAVDGSGLSALGMYFWASARWETFGTRVNAIAPISATIATAAPIIIHGIRRESVRVSGPGRVRGVGDFDLCELFSAFAFLGTDKPSPHSKYYES